jgi:dihydrofolate reductase
MKQETVLPMRTLGSLALSRSLLRAGLVDRYRVVVFPVITGATGRERIFDGYPVAHVAGVLLDHSDQHLAQRDRAAAAAMLIRGILGDDRSGRLVIGLDPGTAGLG